jgi:hypothetical protein
MTLDDAIAALSRGHCTRARATECGCDLCLPRFEALDWMRGEIERLRNIERLAREVDRRGWALCADVRSFSDTNGNYAEIRCGKCVACDLRAALEVKP